MSAVREGSCGSPLLAAGRTNPFIVHELMPLAAIYVAHTTACICLLTIQADERVPNSVHNEKYENEAVIRSACADSQTV